MNEEERKRITEMVVGKVVENLKAKGEEDSIMAILRPGGAGEIYSDNSYLNKHCKIRG
ncbi:hypothetical protein KAU40_00235 [Candidatus Parcubacteria bacterium]|nr:hypothetical protein [Candidatus Parcubacteria bacterium]